ncbi:MAG: hypothetical protein UT66_C0017G0018 [candidate division CPR2 bacterium GW2011_GWC1_39_9]|nr:MAG: hypothetical protein UT66_C0017G0018 [candidate division CPR2 bacterium GW2011_GWC1_39_9]
MLGISKEKEINKESYKRNIFRGFLRLSFLASLALFFVFYYKPTEAHAAFNASNIIPDGEFSAVSTMTEQQIQDFLVLKGSSLATYVETKDSWIGPNSYQYPTGCPSENCVNAKGMKASTIIYKAANWYGLNPQVILVTLQKEQSLITVPLSLPDDQWRLNSAMGYGCPDSGGCSDAYKSFSLQTDWATWQLRWNMDKANSTDSAQSAKVSPYIMGRTINIDGVATYLGNGATASLYRYTPHFHGNQNFYSIYTSWFNFNQYFLEKMSVTSYISSNLKPAKGEDVTITFKIKNNASTALTMDSVGVVGRPIAVTSSVNRDFGWSGMQTFVSGEEKTYVYTSTVRDIGNLFTWPAIAHQGNYAQYFSGGLMLITHKTNLTASHTYISPYPPIEGDVIDFLATVTNNEPKPIRYSHIGIPVRFYGQWNYDSVWMGSDVIPAGGKLTLQGKRTFDKRGSYSYWVSYCLFGEYETLGNVHRIDVSGLVPSFTISNYSVSNNAPSRGEDVTVSYKLKNNIDRNVAVDVGVVGRIGKYSTSPNLDFGWSHNVSFAPLEQKQFSFTTTITEVGDIYHWAAYYYKSSYTHYRYWQSYITSHQANLKISTTLTLNPANPKPGDKVIITATVSNYENKPIRYTHLGIPVRFYDRWNYDSVWVGPGTIAAGGTVDLVGAVTLDKPGPYTYWVSWELAGVYTSLSDYRKVTLN